MGWLQEGLSFSLGTGGGQPWPAVGLGTERLPHGQGRGSNEMKLHSTNCPRSSFNIQSHRLKPRQQLGQRPAGSEQHSRLPRCDGRLAHPGWGCGPCAVGEVNNADRVE